MKTATIAAIATPPGTGGIGIIKISGPEALKIAATLFRSCKNDNKPSRADSSDGLPTNVQSHRLYYGHIVDPETGIDVDEVLVVVMLAPHSYTREDVVEIQAHAGAAVLRVILALVLRQGARMAEPGEFTQRAFLNGRIDLTQAEAVIDIINARTETALNIATNQVSGQLKRAVENIRGILLDVLVHIEAAIDFPEDVSEILSSRGLEAKLRREVAAPIADLMRNYR
ncbi:MAG: tRNA uridine-5-carboxymethylaminomethyl(34) synthesis GTPase MnmE, partial [Desulfobacterales bacterium]